MPDREDLNDEDRCPCCRSLGELPILACELCGAPPGCEACRCVDGDAWGGPSCCAAAMAAFEAIAKEGRTAFVVALPGVADA